jgi:hypothetical protein
MTTVLQSASAAENLILASAGSHAREEWRTIINRKSDDIRRVKHTVWVVNSNAARPDAVQSFCTDSGARYVLFVSRERNAKPGPGTLRNHEAGEYSRDSTTWLALEKGLSHVTGDIKRSTTGFWFDALEDVLSGSLELESFLKLKDNQILTRFWPSDSAYPVRRAGDVRPGNYQILAAGRLASPFAVWLRT